SKTECRGCSRAWSPCPPQNTHASSTADSYRCRRRPHPAHRAPACPGSGCRCRVRGHDRPSWALRGLGVREQRRVCLGRSRVRTSTVRTLPQIALRGVDLAAEPKHGESVAAFVRFGRSRMFNVGGSSEMFAHARLEGACSMAMQHESCYFVNAD